jgi:hypothetical protein
VALVRQIIAMQRDLCCDGSGWCRECGGVHRYRLGVAKTGGALFGERMWERHLEDAQRPRRLPATRYEVGCAIMALLATVDDAAVRAWLADEAHAAAIAAYRERRDGYERG